MYTHWIYIAFVQLRKQFYKIKKNRNLDRYSRIESLKNEFITFRRFCDAIDELIEKKYEWIGKKEFEKQELLNDIFELKAKI